MARYLILILIIWFSPNVTLAQGDSNSNHSFAGKRAMLDGDIPYWADREYVDRTLERIKSTGFNVYMPTVWQGRGTTWPSRHAPWDTILKNLPKTNFDPLEYLIDKAHQMGIEVHPWFTLTLRQSDIFPEFALPGTPKGAFDVHNAEFRRLMANLVAEVVEKYDVDGINLDYVRAIGLCTNPDCKREYTQIYGRNLEVDTAIFKLTFGKVPTLVEYQELAVKAMIAAITDEVRKRKPNILISVDALVGQISVEQGQNSIEWANKGMIDVIFRMDYRRQLNTKLADDLRGRLNNPDSLNLLISNMSTEELPPGQKHFARDGKWLAETISTIYSHWPKTGVAIYVQKYLTDEQTTALKAGPFHAQHGMGDPSAPSGLTAK
jgi:uncharacterized lipoprotein YddW (UPF0748 family)